MTEFRRLLDDPSEDGLALALLRSAADDTPDQSSLMGAATALGVGVGAALASAAATSTNALAAGAAKAVVTSASASTLAPFGPPAASASLIALFGKPLVIGLATGLAAMGGIDYVVDHGRATSATPVSVTAPVTAQAGKVRESMQGASPAALPVDPEPVADEPSNVRALVATTPVRAFPRASAAPAFAEAPIRVSEPAVALPTAAFVIEQQPPAATTAAPVENPVGRGSELTRQLAREVALLDRARGALGRKDAPSALRALEEYASERRSGNFDPEATVLRIKALFAVGDRSAAARLAKGFVAKHPDSQHASWLRSLAE